MDNKYYIPSIEDIRVGYKCEVNRGILPGLSEGWSPIVLTTVKEIVNLMSYGINIFRTLYLTKEQLEAEGWYCTNPENSWFKKGNYNLILYPTGHRIQIANLNSSWGAEILFEGYCPSINEFRFIINLINTK